MNKEGFMEARLADCTVTYRKDIYDNSKSVSSVYYRFYYDDRNKEFPYDMTESTYKFVVERIRYMIQNRRSRIHTNQCFGNGVKHIRIKAIICTETLPENFTDMAFSMEVYNEQDRSTHTFLLKNKNRVTNPNKKKYQNGKYLNSKNVVNKSVEVNNVAKTTVIAVIDETPKTENENAPGEIVNVVESPIITESDSYIDDFKAKMLELKESYTKDHRAAIELYEEDIENHKREIARCEQEISKIRKTLSQIEGMILR